MKKPKDTVCYHYHNENPANIHTDDCVMRALSLAMGSDWESIYKALFIEALKQKRTATETEVYGEYLKQMGWVRMPCPRQSGTNKRYVGTKKRYTGVEFARLAQKHNMMFPIVMHIGTRHVVCFKQGKFNDIWDSTLGAVGIVWVRKEDVDAYNAVFGKVV